MSEALQKQGIIATPEIIEIIGRRLKEHMTTELVYKAYKEWRNEKVELAKKSKGAKPPVT